MKKCTENKKFNEKTGEYIEKYIFLQNKNLKNGRIKI